MKKFSLKPHRRKGPFPGMRPGLSVLISRVGRVHFASKLKREPVELGDIRPYVVKPQQGQKRYEKRTDNQHILWLIWHQVPTAGLS